MQLRQRAVPEKKRARETKAPSPHVNSELTFDLGDGKQKYVVVRVGKRTVDFRLHDDGRKNPKLYEVILAEALCWIEHGREYQPPEKPPRRKKHTKHDPKAARAAVLTTKGDNLPSIVAWASGSAVGGVDQKSAQALTVVLTATSPSGSPFTANAEMKSVRGMLASQVQKKLARAKHASAEVEFPFVTDGVRWLLAGLLRSAGFVANVSTGVLEASALESVVSALGIRATMVVKMTGIHPHRTAGASLPGDGTPEQNQDAAVRAMVGDGTPAANIDTRVKDIRMLYASAGRKCTATFTPLSTPLCHKLVFRFHVSRTYRQGCGPWTNALYLKE